MLLVKVFQEKKYLVEQWKIIKIKEITKKLKF